ncbi:alkaline phosphatase PhoX [Arthrobacter sp.]|uniref:alkaline phosphatase PhoX n=1 Tax=Arthrobacter sp. TaxID=1667 RepID=UPI0028126826|nr:alkaline phosphatase PhoX [Arthrobacter sp.]
MSLSRRNFVGVGVGVAALGFVFVGAGSLAPFVRPGNIATRNAVGYGALVSDSNGILALPEGFSYKLLARSGQTATAEGVHPSDPDGIGVFDGPDGGSVLICNHENSGEEPFPVPVVEGLTYDPGATGGTSTLIVDAEGNRVGQYTSVAGTNNNCAGGISPWGTWLTCEETEARAGSGANTKDHGYVFEVDPASREANINRSAVPLKFLGRYSHEAVTIDPATNQIYLTEDAGNPNGLYLRWTPPTDFTAGKGRLHALAQSGGGDVAGRLQAMKCFLGSTHVKDLSEATTVGATYRVEWIDVPDRDARTTSVRRQFTNDQITRARKLEGQWWGDDGAYFVSSFARIIYGSANSHDGQVWFYDPATESITLKTIFGVNPNPNAESGHFDGPDNITVAPQGGLILAEDGDGVSHLVGVTSQGRSYPLARNEVNDSEFCGPAFSRDGKWLFANIQSPGFTLAITGPWIRPSDEAA